MVETPTVVLDSQVFRWQNRIVFLLAWILHEYAYLPIDCGNNMFYLWSGLNEFGRQHAKVKLLYVYSWAFVNVSIIKTLNDYQHWLKYIDIVIPKSSTAVLIGHFIPEIWIQITHGNNMSNAFKSQYINNKIINQ